ncbi:MAG: cytochrome c biogenesis protein CcdA [Clostridia bacterium]|nr:cytochrome c biogenesis protein CcdA [Clostridia bacterium]
MTYFITFLEGLISFISPCMLPMLPIYLSYFAAGEKAQKRGVLLLRVLAFAAGFTLVFCLLGLFAGTLGQLLTRYRTALNIVAGAIVIVFGLSYLEVIRLPFFKGMKSGRSVGGAVSAFLFGMIYSVSLTPCVGAFLGAALALASASGTALRGTLLLLVYSAGLGVPFLLSALLLDQLKGMFAAIKRHYAVINRVCGGFLILVGILMACGLLTKALSFLT